MSDLAEQVSVQEQSVHRQNRRKLLLWCAISLLNVGLLVLFLTQLLTPASKSGSSDPLVGHPAPDFSLALLSTQSGQSGQSRLSLSDLKGKPIVWTFWNRAAMPKAFYSSTRLPTRLVWIRMGRWPSSMT